MLFQNTNIDKLYGEFRKVANVLFFRRKTRVKDNWKEKFAEVQLQANQHLSLHCMNGILNVCRGSVEKGAQMIAVRYLQCKIFIARRNKQYIKA